jgi:hypothetical protein
MGSQSILETYVLACTGGKLPLSECGPVWQLGIIAALLVCAVLALVVLRVHSRMKSAAAG